MPNRINQTQTPVDFSGKTGWAAWANRSAEKDNGYVSSHHGSAITFPLRRINSVVPQPAEVRTDSSESLKRKWASYAAPPIPTSTDPSHFAVPPPAPHEPLPASVGVCVFVSDCRRVAVFVWGRSNALVKSRKLKRTPWSGSSPLRRPQSKHKHAAGRPASNEDGAACCQATTDCDK